MWLCVSYKDKVVEHVYNMSQEISRSVVLKIGTSNPELVRNATLGPYLKPMESETLI